MLTSDELMALRKGDVVEMQITGCVGRFLGRVEVTAAETRYGAFPSVRVIEQNGQSISNWPLLKDGDYIPSRVVRRAEP